MDLICHRRLLLLLIVITSVFCQEHESDEEEEHHQSVKKQLKFDRDDGVYVLTDATFDDFIAQHPNTLVEFYAPWCGHCKSLAPEYVKAAKRLESMTNVDDNRPRVQLAKVDATVETELGKRFDVKGYPTLRFWKEGVTNPIDYDGGRDADGIVDWISQKTDPNYKPPPEAVVTLTVETFDEFVSAQPLMLVEFYAPWCGHCKQLAPEYEKAAQKLKDHVPPIPLAKVDATVERSLGDKFGVTGYPTLKLLRNGKRFDYNGPRDAAGIAKHMIELAQPAAKKLDTIKAAQRFFVRDDITIIGFFATEQSKLFENFADAAEASRDEFTAVGYTTDPKVMKHFEAKPNDIVIFYPEIFASDYEPKSQVMNALAATQEEVLAFWRKHATPLVGQRTQKNQAKRYTKLPLVVVYYNVDFSLQYRDGTQFWRKKLLKIANQYREQFRFAISDEEEYERELADVGLGDSGLEQNCIVFGADGKKYPMRADQFDGDFDENIVAFMKKISEGRVQAHVKSQPLPKDDKGPVRTLVASNFAKVALDESKDVLIEFYAPWCGHCKAFEPKYKQLAAKLKTEQPHLVLAKFDATANDPPEGYTTEGFPTIYFAPAGKKTDPIKYTGNRDLDDLTAFMKKHAVKSFVGDAKKKTEL